MHNLNTTMHSTLRSNRRRAGVVASVMTVTLALPIVSDAQTLTPPAVPPEIAVSSPNEAFLIGHAFGTQNYECQPAQNLGRVAWTLFTPEATLLDELGNQLTTHFFSPNPIEGGTVVRATWQHSVDTSTVWARATGSVVVDPTAIAWVRLQTVGTRVGPNGGTTLSVTTFIQRVNTVGGVAPKDGCEQLDDVGRKAFVPYTADYVFYTQN
jgi:hypothetical protein